MDKIKLTRKEYEELKLVNIENNELILTDEMPALIERVFTHDGSINERALDELFEAKEFPELIEIVDNETSLVDTGPLRLDTKVTARITSIGGGDMYLLRNKMNPEVFSASKTPINNEDFSSIFTVGELILLNLIEKVRIDPVIMLTQAQVDEVSKFKVKYAHPFFAMKEAMDNPNSHWGQPLIDNYSEVHVDFLKAWFDEADIALEGDNNL